MTWGMSALMVLPLNDFGGTVVVVVTIVAQTIALTWWARGVDVLVRQHDRKIKSLEESGVRVLQAQVDQLREKLSDKKSRNDG